VPEQRPHILFVCVENSCRSQIAEGFARRAGGDRVVAWSAGSRPAARVDPRAILLMKELGIDLGSQEAKGLDALPPGVEWDVVVTMGCGDACPHLPARTRLDWDLPDPKPLADEEFRRVRDRIRALVGELVRVEGKRRRRDAPVPHD
jgi:arsenate reductase (thioredoxin)